MYMLYKENLTLNDLQWLICHKSQPTNKKLLKFLLKLLLIEDSKILKALLHVCSVVLRDTSSPKSKLESMIFTIHIVTLHKYLSRDESLFYAHVTSGQSGT